MAMIAAATALLLARPAAAVTVLCTELAFLPRSAWNSSGVDGRPAPRSLIESLAPWWGNAVRARELATAVAFSQDAAFTPSNYYTTLRGAAFAYAGNATHGEQAPRAARVSPSPPLPCPRRQARRRSALAEPHALLPLFRQAPPAS